MLLFVIRDHIGTTPLANLQATLTADLQRIWESLSKPAELQDRQLSDYFDLAFTALPHKILAADRFETETRNLRARFVDKTNPEYLFKPLYHKRIPADGVAFYMENIWVRHTSISNENSSYFAYRNKSKPTRTSIFQPSKNSLLNSGVTKSPLALSPNSTSKPNHKNGPSKPARSWKDSGA